MHTINELLDLAKEKQGLKSDRALARALDLAHVTPYRTKGVIPDDNTAFRLAELCELPAEEVLITCHIAKAPSLEVVKIWNNLLKMVANGCIVIATLLALFSAAPTQAIAHAESPYISAQNTSTSAQSKMPLFTQKDDILYIMRRYIFY